MDLKKNKIQDEAVKQWSKNKQSSVIMQTGMGKTFVFFKCLLKSKAKQCLFLAETDIRKQDVLDDAIKYKEAFGIDPLEGIDIRFMLYQSAHKKDIKDIFPKGKYFICADEVDFAISPVYWRFFLNDFKKNYILCLTATLNNVSRVIFEDEDIGTKREVLNQRFPICFEYGLNNAVEDGTTRPLTIYTILHQLDSKQKTIKAGNSKTSWFQTETDAYRYLDDNFRKILFLPQNPNKEFLLKNAASKRATFLYNLPSKIEVCKKLLEQLEGRTVVYGIHNHALRQLGIPCVTQDEPNYKRNLQDFRDKKINQIAGNRKLIRGANLNHIDNIVHFAYYSSADLMQQKAGRMRNDLPTGNLYIFKTIGTQEEKWYESAIQSLLVFPQKEITIK